MNVQEVFSPRNTEHLSTDDEKRKFNENMAQMAWFELHPDMTEKEFEERSGWFREQLLTSDEGRSLIEQFSENDEKVVERIDVLYLASVSKH